MLKSRIFTMFLLLSLAVVLGTPYTSEGANWILFATVKGEEVSIDIQSESVNGPHGRRVWLKTKYNPPVKLKNRYCREVIQYVEFHCIERTLTPLQGTYYLIDDSTITFRRMKPYYVQPDGTDIVLLKMMCGEGRNKDEAYR